MADTPDTPEAVEDMSLIDTPMDAAAPEAPEADTKEPDQPSEAATESAKEPTDKPEGDVAAATTTETAKESSEEPASPEPPAEPSPEERAAKARQAWHERQQTRQLIAEQLDQNYAPKSEADLLAEGLDASAAQIEALRQEVQFRDKRAEVIELNANLRTEAVEVIQDYPVFDPNSKDYDEDFTKLVESQYKTAARLQTDENGIITNAEVPLYTFYKQMNDIYQRGTSKGATQGQADMAAMMARTESPGSATPVSKGEESLDELESRLGDVRIV